MSVPLASKYVKAAQCSLLYRKLVYIWDAVNYPLTEA